MGLKMGVLGTSVALFVFQKQFQSFSISLTDITLGNLLNNQHKLRQQKGIQIAPE